MKKIKKERWACTNNDGEFFLAAQLLLNATLPSSLISTLKSQRRLDLREKNREREREEKRFFFFFCGLVQIPSDLHKRVGAAFIFFILKEDLDPKLKIEASKMLAHRWSQYSD